MHKDYYKTLNINRNATQDEIKKAFRKLSKTHHPDKGGDESTFKELSEAYDTLSDGDKRAKYDRGGEDPFAGFGRHRGGPNMDDIVNNFFNQRARQPQRPKGRSLKISLKVSLEDVYFGRNKVMSYKRQINCQGCGGTGGQVQYCRHCGGKGVINHAVGNAFFRQMQQTICPACQGKGKNILRACNSCNGSERNEREQKVDFPIPRNLMTGQVFTMKNLGDEISGGDNGDLQIQVVIERHPDFKVYNMDLLYTPKVSIIDMILGCEILVPHFEGPIKAKIPELSEVGRKFTLKGKGLKGDMGPGNVTIIPEIVMPKTLTTKDREVLESINK